MGRRQRGGPLGRHPRGAGRDAPGWVRLDVRGVDRDAPPRRGRVDPRAGQRRDRPTELVPLRAPRDLARRHGPVVGVPWAGHDRRRGRLHRDRRLRVRHHRPSPRGRGPRRRVRAGTAASRSVPVPHEADRHCRLVSRSPQLHGRRSGRCRSQARRLVLDPLSTRAGRQRRGRGRPCRPDEGGVGRRARPSLPVRSRRRDGRPRRDAVGDDRVHQRHHRARHRRGPRTLTPRPLGEGRLAHRSRGARAHERDHRPTPHQARRAGRDAVRRHR